MGTEHFHIHFIMKAFLTSVLFSVSVPWELMSLAAPTLMSACQVVQCALWYVLSIHLQCAMMEPCCATWGRMTMAALYPTPACLMVLPALLSAPTTPQWSVLMVTLSAPWELMTMDVPTRRCACPLVQHVQNFKC